MPRVDAGPRVTTPAEPRALERGEFAMRSHCWGHTHTIWLFGEFDRASSGAVRRELLRVEATPVAAITLDLTSVTRMDAAAGSVVLEAQSRSRDTERLTVRRGAVAAQRILEQAGLSDARSHSDPDPPRNEAGHPREGHS